MICKGYLVNGIETPELPFDHSSKIEPVYTEIAGWTEDITKIESFDKLPKNLRFYIELIQNETGVPISIISVGPDRKETIFRSI
jgi:adenylosuccinate synthase